MADRGNNIHERLAPGPRLVSLHDAAADLGLPVYTLRRAIWDGELPQVQIGRSIRVDRQDLEAWLERRKVRGPVL
jgi:excisionase family DNA binding protein